MPILTHATRDALAAVARPIEAVATTGAVGVGVRLRALGLIVVMLADRALGRRVGVVTGRDVIRRTGGVEPPDNINETVIAFETVGF